MSSTSASEDKEKRNPLLDSQRNQTMGDYVQGYIQRLTSGDLGSLPIIIGLIIIALIFQSQNSNFLTPRNFVNLILQMSGTAMIAYGVVFVLLLGEIDLSIGYVSAVSGVMVAILLRQPDVLAIVNSDTVPDPLPTTFVVYLFLRQWSAILFPLILGGGRFAWYMIRGSQAGKTQNQVMAEVVGLAAVGLLLSALFYLTIQISNPFGEGYLVNIVTEGWTWYNAMVVALFTTAAIGLLQGSIITLFRVPSFIVTLAGLLAWNGVVLRIIGNGGTVIIQDKTIIGIANSYLAPDSMWGWLTISLFILAFASVQSFQYITRRNQGLSTKPIAIIFLQVLALAASGAFVVYIVNQDRGVPTVGLILVIFLIVLTFVAKNTQFGRFVYAVGGNPEAARRAGISVTRIRLAVFMISSTLAGFGGIVLSSRLRSVDTGAGGGNLLLNAIAAAVIGGTSLFGGSGRVSSAILGALIIMSVENGMSLLNLASGDKFVITGVVLLVAVIVDSLSRRRQQQSGIA